MDELLGISKKRLKYIFSGKSDDIASSSCTDSEDEEEKKVKPPPKQTDDIISLSDITSDEDDLVFADEDKVKVKSKRIKKEKGRKIKKTSKKEEGPIGKEKLMSVLELLELQARARAIRSQLALETKVDKTDGETKDTDKQPEITKDDSDPEAVIIQSPKKDEIVISSSDSENESGRKRQKTSDENEGQSGNPKSWGEKPSKSIIENNILCGNRKTQKIKIIRDRVVIPARDTSEKEESNQENVTETSSNVADSSLNKKAEAVEKCTTEVMECENSLNKEAETVEEIIAEVGECDNKEKESITAAERTEKSEQTDDVNKKTLENSCSDNERSDNEPDVIVINLDDSDDLGCE